MLDPGGALRDNSASSREAGTRQGQQVFSVEPHALRSVILITATTLPSLNACSFVPALQVQA
jgi:hypothetical protein